MVSKATFSSHDYDDENSSYQINVEEVTAVNFAAIQAALTTLRTATDGITIGNIGKLTLTDVMFNTFSPVTDPFAQRETKWQIVAVDVSGNVFAANEVPIANLGLLENGSPYIVRNGDVVVVVGATEVQAFVNAFEAIAKSPSGEALVIKDIYHVGRNV